MKTKSSQKLNKRVLISVSVQGSVGPLRLVVNHDDLAGRVIEAALKLYTRTGRIPVLGPDPSRFLLCYHDCSGSYAVLGPEEGVGSSGSRSFVMAKKPAEEPDPRSESGGGGASSSWKAWIHRSLSFKITSH